MHIKQSLHRKYAQIMHSVVAKKCRSDNVELSISWAWKALFADSLGTISAILWSMQIYTAR